MGCGTSKVLPEPPKDVHLDLVKKVEPYTGYKNDIYKHFIKDGGDAIKSGFPSPPRQTNPCSPARVEQPEPRKNRAAKYRAKFDPRVTAKYDIKALIGRGSFSRVVRVEHKATKQPYAIKMIETKYREGREVCESELCVLRRVRHTNIIQLIEVFESQERVYMVMELATGGELFDRIIAKGSFTERDATRVLQMVLDGVKYLHTLGITHRDLKPENLLYYHPGMDSKIMITDFGLASARKKGDDCLMKTTCGTPEYIAPEILVRKPYTNSVDMWALGVISYILLSGTMPFEDDNRTRLYRQILKGKYSYSGEVSVPSLKLGSGFCVWMFCYGPCRKCLCPYILEPRSLKSCYCQNSFWKFLFEKLNLCFVNAFKKILTVVLVETKGTISTVEAPKHEKICLPAVVNAGRRELGRPHFFQNTVRTPLFMCLGNPANSGSLPYTKERQSQIFFFMLFLLEMHIPRHLTSFKELYYFSLPFYLYVLSWNKLRLKTEILKLSCWLLRKVRRYCFSHIVDGKAEAERETT